MLLELAFYERVEIILTDIPNVFGIGKYINPLGSIELRSHDLNHLAATSPAERKKENEKEKILAFLSIVFVI